ncbi:MAG: D-(-)-3-hydroxybutyrate oligomer hydrolase [Rhodocyclaceae bacterium]|nr:D-(-)-3-hydroxybutyrate oligomer hydrolase [Rhodocyclaceae bacterium]
MKKTAVMTVTTVLAGAVLYGCGGGGGSGDYNTRPAFLSGAIVTASYDGASDDLLTGGLGLTGLLGAAPAYANAAAPTPAELRRNAIHTNYRAVLDFTALGGFGRLYGPNIDVNGNPTLGEGRVAGTEYIALADDGSGRKNVTLMVQVPHHFDKANACIVTGTSSGSRGIYGAIGSAGEWGLKRGCAVAYTDKGTGNGLHDLMSDSVNRVDGVFGSAAAAGASSVFRADLSAGGLAAFNVAFPNRVAYKHAHSQRNPEKDWGLDTLNAVRFAFYVLNEQFAAADDSGRKRREIKPSNTIVIASSISNGGGAALAAAEQDSEGLIDGVAVTEPNAQPRANAALTIRQGAATVATHSKPLVDYFSYANLYQPCAALSAGLSLNPAFWPAAFTTAAENRCAALAAQGLLAAATTAAQADEALAKLHAYGWQAEHDFLQQSHFRFATNAIVMTYVNAFGRFSVADNVCGFSFANTAATGEVVPQAGALQAGIFASGNGVPPTTGVNVVYNDSVGGARLDFLAVSPTSGLADFALDGALCMRELVTGREEVSGLALTGERKARSDRVRAGIEEVLLTGNLRGKPAIIVTGREDTLVPPNHASRAYYGKNRMVEGSASRLSYVEVTPAQHFDTFIAFGPLLGYDSRYVPLHHYFGQAMDRMYAHLRSGAALPPSQVVRATPRASGSPVTLEHLPAIASEPLAADRIALDGNVLVIPD